MGEPSRQMPRHLVVEGPIGVGKTTLTRRLANTFNYHLFLEAPEVNPFLERFYQNQRQLALQTQLFFLFERVRQMEDIRQSDLFEPVRVADFLIEKDKLFASINLDQDELQLYEKVYSHLVTDVPVPDLVIYLQASVDTLLERIATRGIAAEQQISRQYLQSVVDAYTEFFHRYDNSPLIIVNAETLDFSNGDEDFDALVNFMQTVKHGRHYYNPSASIF